MRGRGSADRSDWVTATEMHKATKSHKIKQRIHGFHSKGGDAVMRVEKRKKKTIYASMPRLLTGEDQSDGEVWGCDASKALPPAGNTSPYSRWR